MASPIRIKDISRTVTTAAANEYLAVDGPSGSGKMLTPDPRGTATTAAAAAVAGHDASDTAHRVLRLKSEILAARDLAQAFRTLGTATLEKQAHDAAYSTIYVFDAAATFYTPCHGLAVASSPGVAVRNTSLSSIYSDTTAVEFVTDAEVFEFKSTCLYATPIYFYSNGLYLGSVAHNEGGDTVVKVDLTGQIGSKVIRIEARTNIYWALFLPATNTAWKRSTRTGGLLFGDSLSTGTGAVDGTVNPQGFSHQISRRLGVPLFISGQGSTGIVATSGGADSNYSGRIGRDSLATLSPEFVLVEGSTNDGPHVATVEAAALSLFQQIRAMWPAATIFASNTSGVVRGTPYTTVNAAMAAAFTAFDDPNSVWVDTYSAFTDATAARYLQASPHPNLAGHSRIASVWINALTDWARS